MEPLVFSSALQTEWHVADVLKGKDTTEHRQFAAECRGKAMAAIAALDGAVIEENAKT